MFNKIQTVVGDDSRERKSIVTIVLYLGIYYIIIIYNDNLIILG